MEIAVVRDFDLLCRLCGTKTEILTCFPIFESGEQTREMDKKIGACLPVQVSITDQLPKVICESCALKVDELYDFHEKALHTEEVLKDMLKTLPKEQLQQYDSEISDIHGNLDNFAAEINDIKEVSNPSNNSQTDVTNLQVINSVNSMDQKDIIAQDGIPDEADITNLQLINGINSTSQNDIIAQNGIPDEADGIEVAPFHLDSNVLRIVNAQMNQVSGEDMSMHLSAGDMTVAVENLAVENHLSQLGISYDGATQKQTISHCDDTKCSPLDPQSFTSSRAASEIDEDPLLIVHSPIEAYALLPMEHCNTMDNESVIAQYTKSTKDALLESALNNPAPDGSQINWYLCPFCNEATVEPSSLATHYEHHFCSCSNCDLYFLTIEALTHHAQECLQTKSNFSVEIIDSDLKKPVALLNKKKSLESRPNYLTKVCPECGKEYRTNYKLQEHMRKHTGVTPYKCPICGKAFRSKIGVSQHTATHTGQFAFTCSTCGKGFQCKSYLVVHQRAHSEHRPYSCNTCSQKFKSKQSLLDHINRHKGIKPFRCEICGRGFVTKGLCKSHTKVHSGVDNRQYPCEVCHKLFVSKSYLNTHMRIHTGEKPYLCEVCGKGFLTRVDLKMHMMTHTGEKSLVCEQCGKVFARRSALRCHMRCHTGERPYKCDTCGQTFTQFSPMAIHKRLHTGERPYVCDFCGKRFISRALLASHLKSHKSRPSQKTPQDFSLKNLQDDKGAVVECNELII